MNKPIIVITHERSGTHLLINLINYNKCGRFFSIGYLQNNQLFTIDNYKHQVYKDIIINSYINDSVSKSHHQIEYMTEYLDFLFNKYYVIYLKRDPKDVLVSYYKFLKANKDIKFIEEFPKIEDWIFSNPKNIAYKHLADYPDPHVLIEPVDYIDRWKLHIDGWMKYKDNMLVLNYEDILNNFSREKDKIENYIKRTIGSSIPDIKDKNLPNFNPGKGIIGGHKELLSDSVTEKINFRLIACY